MRQSSSSIGTLAAALAKAQAQLTNPEKSLTATIRAERPGGGERSFRYAPLASGLEIVRKTLSQHEIAIVQATAVDDQSGMVKLTTTLAHSSGEWIASDWPVCRIADLAVPHRMGAALTYARRYGLFTLVGIAGEDDHDAPDLDGVPLHTATLGASGGNRGSLSIATRRNGKAAVALPKTVLPPEQSEPLRQQLLRDVRGLVSADDAVTWAQRILPLKNTLAAADAGLLEQAFAAKMATLEGTDFQHDDLSIATSDNMAAIQATSNVSPSEVPIRRKHVSSEPAGIDKALLSLSEPRRVRNKAHVQFVSKQPCLICGRQPADAHHLRFSQRRALGRKVSDEFTVPLCRTHHRQLHRCTDERSWWQTNGVDPLKIAESLWQRTTGTAHAPSAK